MYVFSSRAGALDWVARAPECLCYRLPVSHYLNHSFTVFPFKGVPLLTVASFGIVFPKWLDWDIFEGSGQSVFRSAAILSARWPLRSISAPSARVDILSDRREHCLTDGLNNCGLILVGSALQRLMFAVPHASPQSKLLSDRQGCWRLRERFFSDPAAAQAELRRQQPTSGMLIIRVSLSHSHPLFLSLSLILSSLSLSLSLSVILTLSLSLFLPPSLSLSLSVDR